MTKCLSRSALLRTLGGTVLAATMLVTGLPASAQAAAGSRTVAITFDNDTGERLVLTDKDVNDGQWTRPPRQSVGAYKTVKFGSQSVRWNGGTEGYVTYDSDYGEVMIRWSNPYLADSTFRCDAPSEYDCDVDGGDPQDERAKVSVVLTES
jgi:hypothetical protein